MKRFLILLALLGACRDEEVAVPDPVPLTAEATSHYCQMNLAEHGGPKAQIHLKGYLVPLFFSQVRDALAYMKGPERDAEILVAYVSDMGAAPSWDAPGVDNWIRMDEAVFVVGADVKGGMGAPEIVPFASRAAADAFAAKHGAEVMNFEAIPPSAVLGAVEITLPGEDGQ